jgi:hypothetical protein
MAFDSALPPDLPREDRYILHNYYRLTSWEERWLHRLCLARRRGDAEIVRRIGRRVGEAGLAKLRALGETAYLSQAAQRIRRENAERIVLVHCPACGLLARTPRSRLCLDCGARW